MSTSPIKKPLTPTNNHPLQNLQEVYQEEPQDDDDHEDYTYEEKTAKNDENRNKVNYMMLNNKNNINLNNNKNEITEEIDDNQNDSNSTTTKSEEVATHETGTGIVTKELEPDQVVRRQKKATNATTQQKTNQRASFPMITKTNFKPTTVENPGFECSDIEKLEGKAKSEEF